MQEIFYEECCLCLDAKAEKIKHNLLKILSYISFILSFAYFCFFIWSFNFLQGNILIRLLFTLLPLIFLIGLGVLFNYLKNNYCVDYDYTIISSTIKFSKVINNKNRKLILKFNVNAIEKMGLIGSQYFEKIQLQTNVKKYLLTSNDNPYENKNFYYIYANINSQKALIILECSKTFILNVYKQANKLIKDGDF